MNINVVGVIQNNEGKLLLVLNKKLNKWIFPGGHLDENESPDIAIVREIKEELGLETKIISKPSIQIETSNENSILLPEVITRTMGTLHFLYKLEIIGSDSLTIQESEIQEAKYFSKEEIANLNTFESVRQFIKL